MAQRIKRKPHTDEGRANIRKGLDEFYQTVAGEARKRELEHTLPFLGAATQFKSGNTPANKGKRGIVKHTDEARAKCGEGKNKAILQFSEGGELITEWQSIKDACRETGLSHVAIWYALTGRRKTAGGYRWNYKQN